MCIKGNNVAVSETKSQYRICERSEYGVVKSIDLSLKLIKEFLEMRSVVENIPFNIPAEDEQAHEHLQKMIDERVKPFMEHFSEALDQL